MFPARVRARRPVIAAAVALAALLGGAGVALAASSSSAAPRAPATARAAAATPAPSRSRCQIKLPLPGRKALRRIFAIPGPPVAFGLGPLGFGPLGAIHGQFVTPKPGGGYRTIDTQRGTVTSVSTSSLTVRSSDGYTKTYQVTGSTIVDARRAGIGSVNNGQTVSVLATVHGSSATARQIVDLTVLPKLPGILRPGPRPMLPIRRCASVSISR